MNKEQLAKAIQNAFTNGMDYAQYRSDIQKMVLLGKTSGENQSEAMVNYTKLNDQRMNRWDKKVHLSTELETSLKYITSPQHWVVLTEAWCGDAAHNIPTLIKIAAVQPLIQVKMVYRDENLELMDAFLTNGGRSIPKVILADKDFQPFASWGPRPEACQKLYLQLKNEEADFETMKIALQQWYNKNKQQALMSEFCDLIQQVV